MQQNGLVDRVFAIQAGSRGFFSHLQHMSKQFFQSNRPGYPHPVELGYQIRWSVIAVSLNIESSVCQIKQAKLCMCMQTTTNTTRTDECTALGVRDHGSLMLSHTGNWITETTTYHKMINHGKFHCLKMDEYIFRGGHFQTCLPSCTCVCIPCLYVQYCLK